MKKLFFLLACILVTFASCNNDELITDTQTLQSSNNRALQDAKNLPTIQEAWIDPGFMEWTDSTKTALIITDLGRQQEYLPDVCDGEQLSSARGMFASAPDPSIITKLRKGPMFNSENCIYFEAMFASCEYMTEIPLYNTSKGTSFHMTFSGTALTTIPELDFSNGTNFSNTFAYCTSLTMHSDINMPKEINLSMTYTGCSSLKKYHFTQKPSGLGATFLNCISLEIVDGLDISNCYLSETFSGTENLKTLKIKGLGSNNGNKICLRDSKYLSIESLEYMIENGNNLGNKEFYIQVNPDVYKKISSSLHDKAKAKNFEFTDFGGYIDPLGNFME